MSGSVSNFERLNRLGEGTYGTVFRSRDKRTHQIVALKKVRHLVEGDKDGFPHTIIREISALRRAK